MRSLRSCNQITVDKKIGGCEIIFETRTQKLHKLNLELNHKSGTNQTATLHIPALQCYVDQWLDHAVLEPGACHQLMAVPVVVTLQIQRELM
jgi:hypothetical protein